MMISIIVAVAENGAIGKDNALLWHISEDMKYFRRTTSGHAVIMGYKTFLSLKGRPLPDRRNMVLHRKDDIDCEGIEVFSSLEAALQSAGRDDDEVFIIGGGMVYRSALPLADRLYITEVYKAVEEADTFFPVIDREQWQETGRTERKTDEKSGLEYSFVTYVRKQ